MENKIFYDCKNRKGIIIISHGMGEHQGLYKDIASFFNDNNFGVVTYDVAGHGENIVNNEPKFQDFVEELDVIVKETKKIDRNVYLLGFSMGALISSSYATTHNDINGLVVISGKYAVMKKIIIPGILFKNKKLKLNFIDNNKRHVPDETLLKDEQLLKSVKFRLLYEVLYKGLKFLNKNMTFITAPTLVLHGGSDVIVSHLESVVFYEKINTTKEIIIYPNSKHDVLFDIDSDLVKKDIVCFLNGLKKI